MTDVINHRLQIFTKEYNFKKIKPEYKDPFSILDITLNNDYHCSILIT